MDQRLSRLAKRMRRAPSATERKLWAILRDRRLEDLKFRRQVVIGSYVVDFVCMRHRLIVEADGPFHDAERDAVRDDWLKGQGFRVLRFPNQQIAEISVRPVKDHSRGPMDGDEGWFRVGNSEREW